MCLMPEAGGGYVTQIGHASRKSNVSHLQRFFCSILASLFSYSARERGNLSRSLHKTSCEAAAAHGKQKATSRKENEKRLSCILHGRPETAAVKRTVTSEHPATKRTQMCAVTKVPHRQPKKPSQGRTCNTISFFVLSAARGDSRRTHTKQTERTIQKRAQH